MGAFYFVMVERIEMAEKLSEADDLKLEAEFQKVVGGLKEDTTDEQTPGLEELRIRVANMKLKMQQDKRLLDTAIRVEKKEGESLNRSMFGLIVKDGVDSILKGEVVNVTMQMSLFRNNVSSKQLSSKSKLIKDKTRVIALEVKPAFLKEKQALEMAEE